MKMRSKNIRKFHEVENAFQYGEILAIIPFLYPKNQREISSYKFEYFQMSHISHRKSELCLIGTNNGCDGETALMSNNTRIDPRHGLRRLWSSLDQRGVKDRKNSEISLSRVKIYENNIGRTTRYLVTTTPQLQV